MSLSTVGKAEKYGLVTRKNPANSIGGSKRLKVSAIFSREDDEDDNGTETNAIQKANREIFSRPTTNLDSEQLDDIYDYDGQYESFKQDREKEILSYQQTTITNPSSRYIDSLKAAAKVREKEKDRRFERKLLKERNEEDGEFGDKPKFITSAYKHKLQEDKQWEYEDRLAEEIEKRQDVKVQGMQNFYANLFTKNISMGNDINEAISAYTSGSKRQKRLDGETGEEHLTIEPTESKASAIVSEQDGHRFDSRTIVSDKNVSKDLEKVAKQLAINAVAPAPAAVSSKEDQIAAAKQRYLARKRTINQANEKTD